MHPASSFDLIFFWLPFGFSRHMLYGLYLLEARWTLTMSRVLTCAVVGADGECYYYGVVAARKQINENRNGRGNARFAQGTRYLIWMVGRRLMGSKSINKTLGIWFDTHSSTEGCFNIDWLIPNHCFPTKQSNNTISRSQGSWTHWVLAIVARISALFNTLWLRRRTQRMHTQRSARSDTQRTYFR